MKNQNTKPGTEGLPDEAEQRKNDKLKVSVFIRELEAIRMLLGAVYDKYNDTKRIKFYNEEISDLIVSSLDTVFFDFCSTKETIETAIEEKFEGVE